VITYIDTSVLMKLFIEEEGTDESEQIWLRSTAVVCAEIGYVEVRAALAAAYRARRLDQPSYDTAKSEFDGLWSQLETVVIDEPLVRSAAVVAETGHLRGYDAVHLAAALRIGATVMASADTALCEAASNHGVDIANPLAGKSG
jgi:uncharacterized protein